MAHKGEVTVDQAHRGYSTATDGKRQARAGVCGFVGRSPAPQLSLPTAMAHAP
jgi:hypothetical protein